MRMKKVNVGFNRNFKEFNECKKRYRLAKGSAGSGKSVNIAQNFIIKLGDPKYKGANLLCVRKVDTTNKDSTYAELKSAIYKIYGDKAGLFWQIRSNPMELISKVTGNKVIFRGMKDDGQREKVKSITFDVGKLTWIWIEEATELYEADVDILDDRLRGDLSFNPFLYYQITFSFNPVSATHWLKAKYFDIKSDDVYTHQSTYLQNRFIDEAYHRRMMMRKERDPDGYRIYGLGEWGETGGLILTNYVVEEFNTSSDGFDYILDSTMRTVSGRLDSRMEISTYAGNCMYLKKIRPKSYSWLRENSRSELPCIVILLSQTGLRCGRKQDTEHVRSRKSRTV